MFLPLLNYVLPVLSRCVPEVGVTGWPVDENGHRVHQEVMAVPTTFLIGYDEKRLPVCWLMTPRQQSSA